MGNQRRVLPCAQSITVHSWATGCNGARTRSKIARMVSAFVYRWASLAQADSPVNLRGTGSNATSRIGILAGLFLVRERILPIVMYSGQAFLSPEKLVRCVWSDNPIMGTTVDPAGKVFYQGTEWAVSIGNTSPKTCQDVSHTCISHYQSAVCISENNRTHTGSIFLNRCVNYMRAIRDLADHVVDTVNNIWIIESCYMGTSMNTGFRPD